jgi:hypothetical protein
MQVQWIGIVISSIALIGGIVSHFFIVGKKIAILETKVERAENDIVELKKHIPLIEFPFNAAVARPL